MVTLAIVTMKSTQSAELCTGINVTLLDNNLQPSLKHSNIAVSGAYCFCRAVNSPCSCLPCNGADANT